MRINKHQKRPNQPSKIKTKNKNMQPLYAKIRNLFKKIASIYLIFEITLVHK